MSARSAKAKGRRLQNFVRDMIRDAFPKLEADDIKSQTMGMTGQDIVLSPIAKKSIPYAIECKNVEKIRIWSAIDQAKKNIENNLSQLNPITYTLQLVLNINLNKNLYVEEG